jgi:excisionase family DNA binding protein
MGVIKMQIRQMNEVMDAKEVARFLGLSFMTVLKYVEKGLIPGFKIGNGKLWRFRAEDIREWLKEKSELEKYKQMSFAEKVNFAGEKIRKGFERAGYTEKDIPRLIQEVRAEKRSTLKQND